MTSVAATLDPAIIERLQRQLIDGDLGLQDYLATARRLKHSVTIVLHIGPNGQLGKPKITLDTRGSDPR